MDVTIVATTWLPPGNERARLDAIQTAISSWRRYLRYDSGEIHLHVSDDGTVKNPWGIYLRQTITEAWGLWRKSVTFSRQERCGVGASLNAGLCAAFQRSPIVLHAVDDWELLAPLDLTPWVNFLNDPNYDVGMVRFFPHPDLEGTVRHIPPHGWAVALQRHHFVFGFRPCLWHKRFFDALGYFDEGVSSFDAEAQFNRRLTWRPPAVAAGWIWLALPEQWRPIETGSLAAVVPG